MNRYFLTGDCHGDFNKLFNFIRRFSLGEGDNIIVLGDTGLCWSNSKKDYYYHIEEWELKCNGVHLYWLDGNHENFNIINNFSLNEKGIFDNSEHIHYLSRGCIFNIGEKKALIMGGADSVDQRLRLPNVSWWKDEMIYNEDLDKVKSQYYDYVFTHCAPLTFVKKNKGWLYTLNNISENNAIHTSEEQLDKLFKKITYGHHYFGHYHIDMQLDNKHTCLYNTFIELPETYTEGTFILKD